MVREEDEPMTLECTYDVSSSYVLLYWYRQYPNREPECIMYKGARSWKYKEDISDHRFQSTTSQSSTSLTTDKADSSLYYCAVMSRLYSPVLQVPGRLYKNSHKITALKIINQTFKKPEAVKEAQCVC